MILAGVAPGSVTGVCGIAAKETIGRVNLQSHFGTKRLDAIRTEQVQRLKHALTSAETDRGPLARSVHANSVLGQWGGQQYPTKGDEMLRSMKDLHGFAIGASDGDIGTVKECYFDDVSYTVRYVVVDTGGWLSERKVLLSPIALRAMDWEHKRITAALTKAQVEKSPDIDTDKPVSRQHEAIYYGYYGYDPYWSGPYLWGASPYPFLGSGPALNAADLERERRWNWEATERANPHLRSSRAVTGYHIQATDGDIGHVEDFLVDDRSWAVRYLIADTSNWWAGKKVLVAPAWVDRVDWDHSKVHVNITRAQIKNSPEYDPALPVERAYETQLYGHYGQPHYWGE